MTRASRSCLALAALIAALATPGVAQIEREPGFFPLEELGLLSPEATNLEINLSGAMLELVAAAMDEEDPEFAELVRGLQGIRVRVADVVSADLADLRASFARATDWLEANGWESLVRLREDDEELYVYSRIEDGEMVGTTVLVLEPDDQVVLVNVVGRLDLALLASLADSLDIPELDVTGLGAGTASDEPEEDE